MQPYLHENHLVHTKTESSKSKFQLNWSRCKQAPKTPWEESLRSAKLIADSHPKLALFFSGGKDSLWVAKAFIHAKIPIHCYTLRYSNGENFSEVKRAKDFCSANSIKQTIIDVDLQKFAEDESDIYCRKIKNPIPISGLLIKLSEYIEETPILSSFKLWFHQNSHTFGNRHYINCDQPIRSNMKFMITSEHKFRIWDYFKSQGRDFIFDFFIYTPESLLSFLLQDSFKAYINQQQDQGIEKFDYRSMFEKYDKEFYLPFKSKIYELHDIEFTSTGYFFGEKETQLQSLRDKFKKEFSFFGWHCDEYFSLLKQLNPSSPS